MNTQTCKHVGEQNPNDLGRIIWQISLSRLTMPIKQRANYVKGDSGAVGFSDIPNTFHRWMVAGLEVAKAI